MRSSFPGPVNIGSEEMVTIDALVDQISAIANKSIEKLHVPGPVGVRGRNSDNRLIAKALGWSPRQSLREGLIPTYNWIVAQVQANAPSRTSTVGPSADVHPWAPVGDLQVTELARA